MHGKLASIPQNIWILLLVYLSQHGTLHVQFLQVSISQTSTTGPADAKGADDGQLRCGQIRQCLGSNTYNN